MNAPDAVLDFWFGAPGTAQAGQAREFWFRKSETTDREIRERFGDDVEAALAGGHNGWIGPPRHSLALILLLDQFTRNIFRDTPRAFAGDTRALELARLLVDQGLDRELAPFERMFVYLPFEHAESLAAQQEALRLFGQLSALGHADLLQWAQRHHDVIARFGRFPHRNSILGRASTAAELDFLQQPGSRF